MKKLTKLEIQDNCKGIDATYVWQKDSGWEIAIGRKLRRLANDELENLWHEFASLQEPHGAFLAAIYNKTFGSGRGKFLAIEDYFNALKEWTQKGEVVTNCE